jgi:hypothetical protein
VKRRREQHEAALQRQVMVHVDAQSARGTFVFHVPNGGKRSKVQAAILKGLGVRAGVPDLICIKAGRVCALELKAPRGRLSAAQKGTIDEMKAAGAAVAVASDIDSALDKLELWGVLRGQRQ